MKPPFPSRNRIKPTTGEASSNTKLKPSIFQYGDSNSKNKDKHQKSTSSPTRKLQISQSLSKLDKFQEEEYSDFIDPSEVVLSKYSQTSAANELDRYFLDIEEWLEKPVNSPEENLPYIIEAEQGVGKKTLLVKWIEFHQAQAKTCPDVVISHFASAGGNNANYFFAIYRILNKLRETLDVRLKVDLVEEKLRKYFSYWLSHCSDKIDKELKYGDKVHHERVIIIIEGVDLFTDHQYPKEVNMPFWLPKYFPQHVRCILTCSKPSLASSYFEQLENCKITRIPVEQNILDVMVKRHSQRELLISDFVQQRHLKLLYEFSSSCKNHSFYKIFLCVFLPYRGTGVISKNQNEDSDSILNSKSSLEDFERIFSRIDYHALKNVTDVNELVEFIINFFSKMFISRDRFLKLLRVFSITHKGLTFGELASITGVNSSEWKLFIVFFKVFIIRYKSVWLLNNEMVKRVIHERFPIEPIEMRNLHGEIAAILAQNTANSIRKIEEETYHLSMSKDYFKLKEVLSNIENFLLLFNPNNKYDFCRYWQILEQHGFDPIVEYNKAIEGFEVHYCPSSQDIFRIIVQISRFLIDFSDFETHLTPEFRHPPIKGTYAELDRIGLLQEVHGLQIYQPYQPLDQVGKFDFELYSRYLKPTANNLSSSGNQNYDISLSPTHGKKQKLFQIHQTNHNSCSSKMFSNTSITNSYLNANTNNECVEQPDVNAVITEKKKQKLGRPANIRHSNLKVMMAKRAEIAKKQAILSDIEALNVDIVSNREQFRQFYENRLKEQIKQNIIAQEQDSFELEIERGIQGEGKIESFSETSESELGSNQQLNQNKSNQHQKHKKRSKKPRVHLLQDEKKKRKNNFQTELITQDQLQKAYDYQEHHPTKFYYKRWLWIQFPWACMSSKCDYSAKLKKCISSAVEYMSFQQEREFTKQALKIAVEAKLLKQIAYRKQNIQSPTQLSHSSEQSHSENEGDLNQSPSQQNSPNQKQKDPRNYDQDDDDDALANTYNRNKSKSIFMNSVYVEEPNQSNQEILPRDKLNVLPQQLKRKVQQKTKRTPRMSSFSQMKSIEPNVFITVPQLNLPQQPDTDRTYSEPEIEDNCSLNESNCYSMRSSSNQLYTSSKAIEKSRAQREKSKSRFDPYSEAKNCRSLSTVLPRLKYKFTYHQHRGINSFEVQALSMKRELDQLINQNRILSKQLKLFQDKEQSQRNSSNQAAKVKKAQQKIEQLELRINEAEENYESDVIQADRMRCILHICKDNKKQNEEWIRCLHFLHSNFSKMIKWEREEIKEMRSQSSQLILMKKSYVNAFDEKLETQRKFIETVQSTIQQKEYFDKKVIQTDSMIEQSAVKQIELFRKQEQLNPMLELERQQREQKIQFQRKHVYAHLQLQHAKELFEKLNRFLDVSDPDFVNSESFLLFKVALDKKDDLSSIIIEKQDRIDSLKEVLRQKSRYLSIIEKAYPEGFSNEIIEEEGEEVGFKFREKKLTHIQGRIDDQSCLSSISVFDSKFQGESPRHAQKSMSVQQEIELQNEVRENQNKLEDLQRKNMKVEQMRLSALMTIQTIQKKLSLNQEDTVRGIINFNEDEMIQTITNKMKEIQKQLSPSDYQIFVDGTIDSTQVYKSILKNNEDKSNTLNKNNQPLLN